MLPWILHPTTRLKRWSRPVFDSVARDCLSCALPRVICNSLSATLLRGWGGPRKKSNERRVGREVVTDHARGALKLSTSSLFWLRALKSTVIDVYAGEKKETVEHKGQLLVVVLVCPWGSPLVRTNETFMLTLVHRDSAASSFERAVSTSTCSPTAGACLLVKGVRGLAIEWGNKMTTDCSARGGGDLCTRSLHAETAYRIQGGLHPRHDCSTSLPANGYTFESSKSVCFAHVVVDETSTADAFESHTIDRVPKKEMKRFPIKIRSTLGERRWWCCRAINFMLYEGTAVGVFLSVERRCVLCRPTD